MTLPETRVPRLDIVLPPSVDGSSFAVYRAASAAEVDVTLPEGGRPQDFFVDGATWQLPRATVTRVHSCAQQVRRGADHIAQDPVPTLRISVIVAGEGELACESGRERQGAGDVTILHSGLAYTSDISDFDLRIVAVPGDRLPSILLSRRVHGLCLPAEASGTRLIVAHVEALVRELDSLSVVEADHAVMTLCGLAAGLVEAHLARSDKSRRRWGDPQLDAAMAYIERRWPDPDLKAAEVCAHLGASRSGLYRLFAPFGGLDTAVRQRRLDHAMRTLLAGTEPQLSMGVLALRHGFRTEANFVRSFQARFGATPIQFRIRLASGDRAWLTEQAGRAGFSSTQAWLEALASGQGGGGQTAVSPPGTAP